MESRQNKKRQRRSRNNNQQDDPGQQRLPYRPLFGHTRVYNRVVDIIDPGNPAFREMGRQMRLTEVNNEGQVDFRADRPLSFLLKVGRVIDPKMDVHQRYFMLRVDLNRDEFLSDFTNTMVMRILEGVEHMGRGQGSDKIEGDDEIENYRALNIVPTANRWNMIDEEDLLSDATASHQYQPVVLEDMFAMRKLKMRSYTCIYESLMVIYFIETDPSKDVPNMNNDDWQLYVHTHFAALSIDVQNMFYSQHLLPCVEWFMESTGIRIGIFNAHRFRQEFDLVLEQEKKGHRRYKYYLIYWGEHVFPARGDILEDLVKNQEKIFKIFNKKYEKLFAMVPHIFAQLHIEAKILALKYNGDIYSYPDQEYKLQFLPDFQLSDIIAIYPDFIQKYRFSVDTQNAYHKKIKFMKEKTEEEKVQLLVQQCEVDVPLLEKMLDIVKKRNDQYYFDDQDYTFYKQLMQFRADKFKMYGGEQCIDDASIRKYDEMLATKSTLWKKRLQRQDKYDKQFGKGFFDIETYIDNSLESESHYNMVPFVACFVGDLFKMYVDEAEYVDKKTGKTQRRFVQRTEMVRGIKQYFVGFHPGECVRKFIFYLMSNSFIYSDVDYTKLNQQGDFGERRRLYNYIFAHNGFGFDFKYLQDELHGTMREFKIVGDSTNMKCMQGNGLFFYDFSLIYRDSLKNLATTFFPSNRDFQKLECDLVINLPKERVAQWYKEVEENHLGDFTKHKEMGMIIDYCMRDCVALQQIVNKFFKEAYSTPFGHGFLPMCFYHSLSSLAYSMFQNCYLTMPIFCNKGAIDIEQNTKAGGFTDGNCFTSGIGVFIDVTSFYPSVMMNEMPVRYKIPDANPFIILKDPKLFEKDDEWIRNINIYKITYKFPADTALPIITQRTADTLVAVLESQDFDTRQSHDDCDAIYVFGYSIKTALELIPGTKVIIYGYIEYEEGDKIFERFITDQYSLRQTCKKNGDKVGDLFHKNLMNSAQGKIGQKVYEKVLFGGGSFIKDKFWQLSSMPDIDNIQVHQLLSDKIDLYELKWSRPEDKWMQTGNTVRIPSYIMAVARTHLLRMQNNVAECLGSSDDIAYYDTDSILIKLDRTQQELNKRIQTMFDSFLRLQRFLKDSSIPFFKELYSKIADAVANLIGGLIEDCESMKKLKELKVKDVTKLDEQVYDNLLHETRLGACKIEKYVIRSVVLGPKQYGVYFVEGTPGKFVMKQSVKLKGVKAHARKMDMVNQLKDKTLDYFVNEVGVLPFEYTELMQRWSRMGGGVNISDVRKVVRVTLTKRKHDFATNSSRPFKNVREFQLNKMEYEQKFKELKKDFVDTLQESVALLEQSECVQKFKQALREQNQVRIESQSYFSEGIKLLRESRKRYMMKLPLIKFDQLQDKVYDLLCENPAIREQAYMLLPKLYLICYHAVVYKKQTSKRGLTDLTDDHNPFSVEKAARCLSYCLFIFYCLKDRDMKIPENFTTIVVKMHKYFIQKILGITKVVPRVSENAPRIDGYHVSQFNSAIIYGFEFLQAPICIYSPKGPNIERNDVDDLPPRAGYELKYSSLWRFFNQLQDRIEQMNVEPSMQDSLFRDLVENVSTDGKLNIRGPGYFHSLFATDRNMQYDIHNNQLKQNDDNTASDFFLQLKKYMHKGGLMPEDLENAQINVLRAVPKVKYDTAEWVQPELLDENIKDEMEQKVAMMVLMGNQLHGRELDLQQESLGKEQIFVEIRKRFKFDTDFNPQFMETLFNVASKGKIEKSDKVCQEDVYDIVLLYSFLRYGKRKSALLFRAVRDDLYAKLEKGRLNKFTLFDEACVILFCRPQMFKAIRGKGRSLSKKAKKLVEKFIDLTTEYDKEITPTDEQYIAHMDLLLGDREIISPELRDLLDLCKTSELILSMGASLFNKILQWRNPDVKIVSMLKAVLMIDNVNWGTDIEETKRQVDLDLEDILDKMKEGGTRYDQEVEDEFGNLKIMANKIDLNQVDEQSTVEHLPPIQNHEQQFMLLEHDPADDYMLFDDFLIQQDNLRLFDYDFNQQFNIHQYGADDYEMEVNQANERSFDRPIYMDDDFDAVRAAFQEADEFETQMQQMVDRHAVRRLRRLDINQAEIDELDFLRQEQERQVREQQNARVRSYIRNKFYEDQAVESDGGGEENDKRQEAEKMDIDSVFLQNNADMSECDDDVCFIDTAARPNKRMRTE